MKLKALAHGSTIVMAIIAIVVLLSNKEYLKYRALRFSGWKLEDCRRYIEENPDGKFTDKVQERIYVLEDEYIENYFNNSIVWETAPYLISEKQKKEIYDTEQKYLREFPDGMYKESVHERVLLYLEPDEYRYQQIVASDNPSIGECESFLTRFPKSKHYKEIKDKLRAIKAERGIEDVSLSTPRESKQTEVKKTETNVQEAVQPVLPKEEQDERYEQFKNNYRLTGSQPYSSYYGWNPVLEDNYSSFITVYASQDSDVVVIIKRINLSGKVVAHVYIRKGESYTINLPPVETYQVLFYSGYGWDPGKKRGSIKGGFVGNEAVFSISPRFFDMRKGVEIRLQKSTSGNLNMSKINDIDSVL